MEKELDEKLFDARDSINCIDEDIVDLLERRFNLVDEIGKIKSISINRDKLFISPKREYELVKKNIELGKEKSIDSKIIKSIWRVFISNANYIEQPEIKILIPNDIDYDLFASISCFYPISQCYQYVDVNNMPFVPLPGKKILVFDLDKITYDHIAAMKQFEIYLYHIELSIDLKKVGFFGNLNYFSFDENAKYIFFDKETHKIKSVDYDNFKRISDEDRYSLFGTYFCY